MWAEVESDRYATRTARSCDRKTGERLENRTITGISPDGTKAWAKQFNTGSGGTFLIIRSDGTHGKTEFSALSSWSNDGKSLVRSSDGSITAIDNQTRELWRVKGVSLGAYSGRGDVLLINYDSSPSVLVKDGRAATLGAKNITSLNQSGETCIVSDSIGYYKVCDLNGRALSRTYQNALYSEGSNLYAGWVKDRTYEIFYCPAGSSAKVLYTVTWTFRRRRSCRPTAPVCMRFRRTTGRSSALTASGRLLERRRPRSRSAILRLRTACWCFRVKISRRSIYLPVKLPRKGSRRLAAEMSVPTDEGIAGVHRREQKGDKTPNGFWP